MKKKFLYFLSIFLFFPNISFGYVDPGIFALIWQSIVAIIFASLAYFKLFYFKIAEVLKNSILIFDKKIFIIFYDFLLLVLVIATPIIQLIKNNQIFYGINDYIESSITLLILFILIILLISFIFKIFSIKKSHIFFLSLFVLIFSYLSSSIEEFFIKSFLNHETIIYLRIISLILTPIILIYFFKKIIKIEINKVRVFFSIFIITIFLSSSLLLIKDSQNLKKNKNENIWEHKEADIKEIPLNNNVFFILTDAYLSPKYFEILYPNEKNLLLEKLNKKNFFTRYNSYSSYSSSKFSIPSIFNSNIFSDEITIDDFKLSLRKKRNILDYSFFTKTLAKNNFNHRFFMCDFKYVFKKRFCKERYTYLSLIEDITIIEGIYYYNTFYRAYKRAILLLYNLNYFRNMVDSLAGDENEDLLLYLEDKIKNIKKDEKNFFSIYFSKPHLPFTLNSNCTWKSIPLSENVKNGFLINDENKRIQGYLDNINCTNNYLVELIDIIEKYNEDPIVVILSDNGPILRPNKYLNNKINKENLLLLDQNSSLFSIKSSKNCLNKFNKNKLHHVNLLKIIFSCDDETFYSTLPYETYLNPITGITNFKFKKIILNE